MLKLVRSLYPAAGAAALLSLGGCAAIGINAPDQVASRPDKIPPMPTLPPGLPASINVPPTDASGAYLTLNHGLDTAETVWHVRSALNVAALACRGPQEAGIIAAYNAMLKAQKASLATALKATEARYKADQGKTWQTVHDRHMTRVYNFFSQPAGQAGFCAAAGAVIAEAGSTSPAEFPTFAARALPRLEAPFTDVYRAYDGYRRDLAQWQARYGGNQVADGGGSGAGQIAAPPLPTLAYRGMDRLLRWDANDRPIRTASR
jgi:hypothetical protein